MPDRRDHDAAIQVITMGGIRTPFGVASNTEDCLYLNVFTPPTLQTLGSSPMPVLVWLHPGGMQSGESDDYIPTAFVKRGFVVVTLNYRLGALGWMAHPDLTAESGKQGSGNYGLMDQQAALRWIQRNIASFGGDKGSVTIIGADAGGVSVFAHIASPASAGLFQRAIAHSGSYWDHGMPLTLSDAETAGTAFANAVGCQTLACLRAAPVSTLLAKQTPGRMTYRPNPDGNAVLPEGVYEALHLGHGNKVPVLSGIAQDEYRLDVALLETQGLPTNASTYQQRIQDLFGIPASTALTYATVFYPPANTTAAKRSL